MFGSRRSSTYWPRPCSRRGSSVRRHPIPTYFRVTVVMREFRETAPPRASSPRRVVVEPPAGDLAAAGEPDGRTSAGVLDEALETADACGAPHDPAVEAHRHELGVTGALLIQRVEGVPEVLEGVVGGQERAPPESDVVGVQRVRHDEPPLALDRHVVGQVVRIRVTVVEEVA